MDRRGFLIKSALVRHKRMFICNIDIWLLLLGTRNDNECRKGGLQDLTIQDKPVFLKSLISFIALLVSVGI